MLKHMHTPDVLHNSVRFMVKARVRATFSVRIRNKVWISISVRERIRGGEMQQWMEVHPVFKNNDKKNRKKD